MRNLHKKARSSASTGLLEEKKAKKDDLSICETTDVCK